MTSNHEMELLRKQHEATSRTSTAALLLLSPDTPPDIKLSIGSGSGVYPSLVNLSSIFWRSSSRMPSSSCLDESNRALA